MATKQCSNCGMDFMRSRPDANRENYCSLACRFWSKVDCRGPDDCWPWKSAAVSSYGYGVLNIKNKVHSSHRLAWELTHGPIENGLHVLHRCDNAPCCNPAHLFLGTHQDNMADMNAKGRNGTAGTTRVPQTAYRIRRNEQQRERTRRLRALGLKP